MTILQKASSVKGPNILLRLVQVSDADYLYGLRVNPRYNAYLSEFNGTIRDQENWIKKYKERERNLIELYYIVERLDGMPCGAVRLYNISHPIFEWGSWILDHNKPAKAALESATLVYTIAFDILGLEEAHFDVRRENVRTLEFHRRYGAIEKHETNRDYYFSYPRVKFEEDRDSFLSLLDGSVTQTR